MSPREVVPVSDADNSAVAEIADPPAPPVLTRGVDPFRSLVTLAAVVRGATAGTTLRSDGRSEPLPGLEADPLLVPGSPVLAEAGARAGAGRVFSSFVWPLGGRHAPGGHVRVTVITAVDDASPRLLGVVLLSPPPELHGLTPRELEVLGLVVEGCSNVVIAHALDIAPRTVAAHLEHLLVKLGTPTRTSAAVRADREGLLVPPLRTC